MNPRPPAYRQKKDSRTNYNLRADFDYLRENNYMVVKEIDRGTYGVVYKAEDISTGDFCAIKINFNIISREQQYIQMGLLKIMRGNNRLPFLHRIIQKKGTYSIIMDFYKSKPFITFFNRFSMTEVKHYLFQLLLGLKQLKKLGIYHRDIKPSNFLYNDVTKRGVIADFGLAQVDPKHVQKLRQKVAELQQNDSEQFQEYNQQLECYKNIQACLKVVGRNKIGTQIFMPLESVFKKVDQDYSSDIWPVGVILLQFCTKRFNIFNNITKIQQYFGVDKSYVVSFLLQLGCIFGKQHVINVCRDVFSYEVVLPKDLNQVNLKQICIIQQFDDVALDILQRLLQLDPHKRISVQQALQHNFFNLVRDEHK